jgi:galactofuranosylgalactofuranosylrhamnosyl-N-acetylglucosaminyl-diphospho-decaprenol beta-1,5/1,6-galactofuranosyltransferase
MARTRAAGSAEPLEVLQRVVFPEHGDPQALPLYIDPEAWAVLPASDAAKERLARARGFLEDGHARTPLRLTSRSGSGWLDGRRGVRVPAHEKLSLATYFNAFPASYWNAWTSLSGVVLRVRTRGSGQIVVYRSNARGVIQRVDGANVSGESESVFRVPFSSFLDGGWLWFDLHAEETPFELAEADWCAPAGEAARRGSATISITTLNRGDYCTALLSAIGADAAVMEAIERIIVVDQGSEKIVDNPGYAEASRILGDRLEVIEQANLGGSGGFARGMLETSEAGNSDYVLLLDDDVEVEPEAIRRAVRFADHCRTPTIVGGHMFDMYDKAKLHAFAEGIQWSPFIWGPLTPDRHDFAESNLRQTRWMHRRFDVDYNGWWMSLIPVSIVREIGLSLPVFIKWDDAEYSLRAREAGYATVSLPGAAVWHVSWVDKDDSHDWQGFFHARNRLIAALLHSPHSRGGRLGRAFLAQDFKNLLTMDYYTVAMKHAAIQSVLDGPDGLHADMVDRLARVRALAAGFTEAQPIRDFSTIPHFAAREVPSVKLGTVETGPTGLGFVWWLARQIVRHSWRRPHRGAKERPDAHLPYQDARWHSVPDYDSVLITNAEGSAVSWHVRNPRRFRTLLRRSIGMARLMRRRWPELSREYRAALGDITSSERWKRTFDEVAKG